MSLEISGWGCAPWIGIWPLIVFFAPVSTKAKLLIFVISVALFSYVFGMYNAIGNGAGLPWATRYLIGSIALVLLLAYFIVTYVSLFTEISRRNRLYAFLGKDVWEDCFYCTVHETVIYP